MKWSEVEQGVEDYVAETSRLEDENLSERERSFFSQQIHPVQVPQSFVDKLGKKRAGAIESWIEEGLVEVSDTDEEE